MTRRRLSWALAAVLLALLGAGTTVVAGQTALHRKTITAYFASATSVYPGDEVRVAGVKVGSIESITPVGSRVRMVLDIAHNVEIPADARAVIVAQNLVAARYVQLTPPYRAEAPVMADGAVIPVERTAIPVEWDEVKEQLTRLATELGPTGDTSTTSVGRVIDSAAAAMDGNGEKLRTTISELSAIGRLLANGSGDIVDSIENLQIFVNALRDSGDQIVQFEGRLATLTSVVNDNRSNLDAALTDLSSAVVEVQRFVNGSRDQTSQQVQRLANVTQNLVDHRTDIENVLHVAPNAIANAYNIYNPDTGSALGSIVTNNLSNPLQFICGAIGAVENVTAPETSKLCAEYLGPGLRLLNANHIPFPVNPYLMQSASPDNIVYADPALAPGASGPSPTPPETPPAISAYTGLIDNPYPAPAAVTQPFTGRPPGAAPPGASPGLIPSVPSSISELLLPAEAPPAPTVPQPAPVPSSDEAPPA